MGDGFSPFHVPQQSRRDKLRVNAPPLVHLYDPSYYITTANFTNGAVNDERGLFTVVDPQSSVQLNPNEPKNLSLELNLQRYDVVGNGPFTGYASVLTGSRFMKPAQQLLQDLCGGFDSSSLVWDTDQTGVVVDHNYNDASLNFHHNGKKSRLVSLLDEICKRYKQYCQQIQGVVAAFESVAGLRDAAPFTNWAIKAMSKHFKCLKNAITDQLHLGCNRDESSLNSRNGQKLFQSAALVDQPVWRPQRGLPERAVSVLRAWLFDHFLHPYPTDKDKIMLAKQTGLSRNQVSNWFINARVRLWKPMVEEIHMLEIGQNQKTCRKEGHPPNRQTTTCSTDSANASTSVQQFPLKRTQDESVGLMRLQYASPHLGFGLTNPGGGNVSLTLGLHQNGEGLSESYPINGAPRFGLDWREEVGYVATDFGAQNRQFGQFMHDFVG